MKIAFCFYGILYGMGGRTGSARNFSHCWPNIKSMLVDPFIAQGHEVSLYFSSYQITDANQYAEFKTIVNPKDVFYSNFENSDAFTAKYASFEILNNLKDDIIILTRSDVHWSKKIAEENINLKKFNFLFPEKEWWNTEHQFTCDNFYIWPSQMTKNVEKAMKETYAFPRGKPFVDTHALMFNLKKYISKKRIHMISDVEELSDVNSFYTCCRSGLPERDCMHIEVKERYQQENWKYYK